MHSIQKLRWKDVLDDVLFPSELKFEWVNLEFDGANSIYNRDGIYVHGPFGVAEVSPLPGYFDREIECLISAIGTVSKLWPKPVRDKILLNTLVVSDEDINESLLEYECVKVKVHSFSDCDRVKLVRDFCGPQMKIRIDCNGMFEVNEAKSVVQLLREVAIELIEQPCRTNKENAKLRRKIDIPLAIDETARTHKEIYDAKKHESADIIVVKVQPSGGIHKASDLVDHWGSEVIIAHMMESQIGIDVGMELAKSLDSLNYACGLKLPILEKVIREPINI